jgi:ferredoxin-nitrite reductase
MPREKRSIEEMKAELDMEKIWARILQWSEGGWDSIPPEEIDLTKWYGLFYRKPTPGYFMIRTRVTGGVLHRGNYRAGQMRALADITRDFGRDIMDFTTRQQVELRWIRINDFPEIFHRLRAAGLDSRQTGMDNIRGVTTCPVAGLAEDEVIDTRDLIKQMTDAFVGDWRYANLPRKFNITIIGCRDNCTHSETNDIGFNPATKDGETGFNVRVGGGEGSWGRQHAWSLDAFVSEDEVVETGIRILDVFLENGVRGKRNRARMKFLIDDWGIEKFREELSKLLSFDLRSAGEDLTRSGGPNDHVGVHPQKESGLYYVGLLAPTGRVTLERVYELCRLAEEYGDGEIRLSTYQNPILCNVPEDRLESLMKEPLLKEMSPEPKPFERGLVTCTGKSFCPFALIETKERGLELARYLDERLGEEVQEELGVFRIHTSGCPNSCARPHAGQIGLIGKQIRRKEGPVKSTVEGANVMLGGQEGIFGGGFNELWDQKVPFEEMGPKVEGVIRDYLDEREEGETFRDWCLRKEMIEVTV